MKTLIATILLFTALGIHAQDYLYPSSQETRNLVVLQPEKGMTYCQDNQSILYSKFLASSRLQMLHLIEVMSEEKESSSRRGFYKQLLREKIFLHILIEQMNKKMKANSLFELYRLSGLKKNPSVLGMEGVRVELGEEISKTLSKVLTQSRFQEIALEHLEHELLADTLKDIAKGTFKAIVSGEAKRYIAKVIAGKVTKELFKKAIVTTGLNMTTHILAGVAKSSLISIVTLPLYGFRYSDEHLWIEITEKVPMLLLNPDWKANDQHGGRAASDWQIHCRTMLWKPEQVEHIFNKFLKKTEKSFYSRVESISTFDDFNNPRSHVRLLPSDGTYVRPKIYPQKVL